MPIPPIIIYTTKYIRYKIIYFIVLGGGGEKGDNCYPITDL